MVILSSSSGLIKDENDNPGVLGIALAILSPRDRNNFAPLS